MHFSSKGGWWEHRFFTMPFFTEHRFREVGPSWVPLWERRWSSPDCSSTILGLLGWPLICWLIRNRLQNCGIPNMVADLKGRKGPVEAWNFESTILLQCSLKFLNPKCSKTTARTHSHISMLSRHWALLSQDHPPTNSNLEMPTQQQWLNEGLFIGIPIQHVGMLASWSASWHPGWGGCFPALALQLPSKETQHTSSHIIYTSSHHPPPKKNNNNNNNNN